MPTNQESTEAFRASRGKSPLTVTIVGCGAVAQLLYRQPLQKLERTGQIQVNAVVDPCEPRAQKLARCFTRAATSGDLQRSLEENPPNLTLVLSPAQLHDTHAIAALSRGSHVLCEKPMATSVEKCTQMVTASQKAGCVLAVGMVRRFIPAFAELYQLIHAGAIGQPLSFYYAEGRRFDWQVTTPAAFRDRNQGGTGVLFDIGPHVLDLLTWLFGAPRVESYADDGLNGVEANAVLQLSFRQCSGQVHLSWDTPLRNELRVYGTKGEAVALVDHFDRIAVKRHSDWQAIAVKHSYPADVLPQPQKYISPRLYTQAILCQLVQTIRAVQLSEQPMVDSEAGLQCVATLENALELGTALDMPWLSPDRQRRFEALHWSTDLCRS